MRDDIREAIEALRDGLVASRVSIDRVHAAKEIGEDERLSIKRVAMRLPILIIALDDIRDALKTEST